MRIQRRINVIIQVSNVIMAESVCTRVKHNEQLSGSQYVEIDWSIQSAFLCVDVLAWNWFVELDVIEKTIGFSAMEAEIFLPN